MREDAEVTLAGAAVLGAPGHGSAESAREGALGLPPLAEHALVPAPLGPGPEPPGQFDRGTCLSGPCRGPGR